MTRSSAIVAVVSAAILAGGCVSLGERNAFSTFRKEVRRRAHFVLKGRKYTKKQLPRLTSKSGVAQYLAYAALKNAGLEAAFYRWKAALHRIPQARALPEPKFTYGYYIQEVETRVGPQRHRFQLMQRFPWYGKLSWKAKVEVQAANIAQQRYEAAKLKLFYRVKKAYYQYYFLGRAIAITRENLALLGFLEKTARAMYTVNRASHADVIRAQVEQAKLEDRLRTLRALRKPLIAELNAALNRSARQQLPFPTSVINAKAAFTDKAVKGWFLKHNPDLRRLQFEAARQKAAIRLARQGYFPDITLGVGVIETGKSPMPGTRDNGKDPIVASLSITLPIWIGKYRAAEREARARYRAAVSRRRQRTHDLAAAIRMALFRFRDADRKVRFYRNGLIPKAEQAFNVTRQSFATGKSDFMDVIDAQRTLLMFRLEHERALAARGRHLARLEQFVGRPLPMKVEERKNNGQGKTEQK